MDLLKTEYAPKRYRYYGIEVTEGLHKPYFFVDLRLTRQQDETANIVSRDYYVSITFQGEKVSEAENFRVVERIRELLCCEDDKNRKRKMVIKVKDRYIKVKEYSFGYTGEKNNILQVTFDLFFYEFADSEIKETLMKNVSLHTEMEG